MEPAFGCSSSAANSSAVVGPCRVPMIYNLSVFLLKLAECRRVYRGCNCGWRCWRDEARGRGRWLRGGWGSSGLVCFGWEGEWVRLVNLFSGIPGWAPVGDGYTVTGAGQAPDTLGLDELTGCGRRGWEEKC
jgi:hypothetical protein